MTRSETQHRRHHDGNGLPRAIAAALAFAALGVLSRGLVPAAQRLSELASQQPGVPANPLLAVMPRGAVAGLSAPIGSGTVPGTAPPPVAIPPPVEAPAAPAALVIPAGTLVPTSIAYDCSTDVTNQLNYFVAAQPDNATIVLQPNGCYEVEGSLSVSNKHGLTIQGDGATLRRTATPTGFSADVLIQGSSNIDITHLTVDGPKPDSAGFTHIYEGQPGYAIDNSSSVTIEDSVVRHVWGDFFRVSNFSDGVTIRNNNLLQAGRQGLAVVGGGNIVFDSNVDSWVHRFAIDLEPYGDTPVHDVTISNNQLLHPNIGFICAPGQDSRCNDRTIPNLTVTNNVEVV